ncbi:MAG: glycoside hydrolase family 9 protein [Oscillospiraceae bacterium]|nr:glycoside hydrolase family 9 protein [Oscillospiraceae bacterium]
MKKHKLTALAAALCLLCTGVPFTGITGTAIGFSASAADEEKLTSGPLTYAIEDGNVTITGFDGSTKTVKIPDKIDGNPVTKIGKTAFYETDITSVTIPEGVTYIESGAFWHCGSLTEIKLPSTLTTIEGFAFNDCKSLEKIDIPESLTSIGKDAFTDTPWIKAKMAESPFVIINGILVDASAVVTQIRGEVKDARDKAAAEAEELAEWRKPGKHNGIITNQVGYFPELVKKATLVTDETKAIDFELLDAGGKTVFTGKSTPFGFDKASGDNVQIIDFSDFKTEGTYTLKAATGETSQAFNIGVRETYSGLMYDALNYFYQNRSGIAIESQYITSGDTEKLARGVAHNPDIATIQQVFGYEGSEGTQDVTGGWYDAGDHGKYVVNGGIALWMMQNQYERASLKGTADAYADGTMKLPENGNSYPDLLDEARYEMEWMLTMMVQDGDYKDMAYHKIHDAKWSALGLDPANDVFERYLLPPSTAATLNLAACGAQAYRLWKDLDPDFAEKCLTAAKNAYAAAQKHPDVLAPNKEHGGGGAYGDSNVTDEFYWAACELFISTGDKAYYDDAKSSKNAFTITTDGVDGVFDWGGTAALGSLSLLLHQDAVSEKESASLRDSLTKTADVYVDYADSQGYGILYGGYTDKNDYINYVWGSNSFVVDDAVILAYAYDETKESKYLGGIVSAMDYILGRNALDFSYVTGYGSHSVQYPHHRFWAVTENPSFPKAPCGVLCGGPNSDIADPAIKATDCMHGETPAQLCYIDSNQAYSVNECAINWNAPLAWVTGYLCEQTGGIAVSQPSGGQQLPEPLKPEEIPYPDIIVTIPDGVTVIGEQIFGKEKGYVQGVELPESVTAISKEAFYRCTLLENLNIPKGIEIVGDRAFGDTPWLTKMLEDTPLLIFNNILIDGTTAEGDVQIPDGVTSVLGSAFKLNDAITSVTMPETVVRIGPSAFQNCSALTSVKLPESLKSIEQSAFAGTGLTELTIPAGVETIGEEAFINCTSLPEVTLPGKNVSIGREAFGCTSTFTSTGQYSYLFVHRVIEDFVVNCYKDSTADTFAAKTGLKVNYLDGTAPTDPTEIVYGDIDCDGKITIVDVISLNKNLMVGDPISKAGKRNADVNKDGKVDEVDSLNILKAVVEITVLPVVTK